MAMLPNDRCEQKSAHRGPCARRRRRQTARLALKTDSLPVSVRGAQPIRRRGARPQHVPPPPPRGAQHLTRPATGAVANRPQPISSVERPPRPTAPPRDRSGEAPPRMWRDDAGGHDYRTAEATVPPPKQGEQSVARFTPSASPGKAANAPSKRSRLPPRPKRRASQWRAQSAPSGRRSNARILGLVKRKSPHWPPQPIS